ncbi:hypothetical protein [Paracoccus sp. (in: a-proteobacteria)]|uniref:hypothetical protein n=1 Tax=Paracoccus sp. TaxID=267 RepID=UPI0032206AA3
MIRDAFDAPAVKVEKRIIRLANFLAMDVRRDPGQDSIDSMSDTLARQVTAAGLIRTMAVVARQPLPIRRLLHVLLVEIVAAHDLASHRNMRDSLDAFIAAQIGDPAIRAALAAQLPSQIATARARWTRPRPKCWTGWP